jgi:hypothetical protein
MTELKMALANMKEYLKKRQSPCLYNIPDVAEAWVYNADKLIKHYAPIARGFSWLTAMQRYRAEVAKKGYVEGESARVLISVTENFVKEVEKYIAQQTCPTKEDKSSITVAVAFDFSEAEKQVAGMLAELVKLDKMHKKLSEPDQSAVISNLRSAINGLRGQLLSKTAEAEVLYENSKTWHKVADERLNTIRNLQESARTWQGVVESRFDSINELKRINAKLELDTNNRAEKIEKLEAEIRDLKSGKPTQSSYVLAYGDLKDGYNLVGPFVSREVAEYYCLRDDPNTEILEVFAPAED